MNYLSLNKKYSSITPSLYKRFADLKSQLGKINDAHEVTIFGYKTNAFDIQISIDRIEQCG